MKIHPSAIIESGATLHDSVEVGPHSIIESGVVIGEGSVVSSGVRIYSGVTIGKNNHIFHNAALGCDPQDVSFDPSQKTGLLIGDHNVFREGSNISRSTKAEIPTTIGDHNMVMSGAHIGHDVKVGDHCFFVSNSAIGGHVQIGNRVFISGLAGVHQFARIGDYAMVGAVSKVSRDVPPYCSVEQSPAVVIGINLVGLKRAGFSSEVRRAIQEAYRIIYHSGLVTAQAIDELKRSGDPIPEITSIIQFLETTKRGITDYNYV